MKQTKYLLISIITYLLLALINTSIIIKTITTYNQINHPSFPQNISLFYFGWIICFLLNGLVSFFIHQSNNTNKESSLILYYFQLMINYLWPVMFFYYQSYLFSLALIVVLIIINLSLLYLFYQINKLASAFLIPCLFIQGIALYLNFWVFISN